MCVRFGPPASPRRPRPAFTLIELLTVIAVIGVLAALLLPTLSAVRASARQAECASNLRQIGTAVLHYAHDHGGRFPKSTHDEFNITRTWIYTLKPYLGRIDSVRLCPVDPRYEERRRLADSTSYLLNEYLVVPGPDSALTLDLVRAPSRTHLAYIGKDTMGLGVQNDHTHSRNWSKGWNAVIADIAPDRHRRGAAPAADRTTGSSNYLFVDAHVESIPAAALKARVDAGDNPAVPAR